MTEVTLQLDNELITLLGQSNQPVQEAAREFIIVELFRRHLISGGKASELMNMHRLEFIQYAANLGISYFDMTIEELEDELNQPNPL